MNDKMTMGRKWIYCILIGISSVLLLCLNKLSEYRDTDNGALIENIRENGDYTADNAFIRVAGHEIALLQKDDQYYAFLPSACKNADVEPEIPAGIEPSSIVWMYSENIPAVFIDTESGTSDEINSDKNCRDK